MITSDYLLKNINYKNFKSIELVAMMDFAHRLENFFDKINNEVGLVLYDLLEKVSKNIAEKKYDDKVTHQNMLIIFYSIAFILCSHNSLAKYDLKKEEAVYELKVNNVRIFVPVCLNKTLMYFIYRKYKDKISSEEVGKYFSEIKESFKSDDKMWWE